MEHLNYCRQMVKQFSRYIDNPRNLSDTDLLRIRHAIDLASASQKFILPHGGRVYDDPEYKALDESEQLKLPFPFIALEYERSGDCGVGSLVSKKAIVFAREGRDGFIAITPVVWAESMWLPMPEAAIPSVNYLDRSVVQGGRVAVKLLLSDARIPPSDYHDEVGALLCFLNLLRCNNVYSERSHPKKIGKKIKSALPFDSYYVLTIGSPTGPTKGSTGAGHRSPREHLRRGHIRRLLDGRRVWVNATVVAAGRGCGVITKDYAIRDA